MLLSLPRGIVFRSYVAAFESKPAGSTASRSGKYPADETVRRGSVFRGFAFEVVDDQNLNRMFLHFHPDAGLLQHGVRK